MVNTIRGYYRKTYQEQFDENMEAAFQKKNIDPGDLAAANHEFICDCLWYANRNENMQAFLKKLSEIRFYELRSTTDRAAAYTDAAEKVAQRIAAQVEAVWASNGRNAQIHLAVKITAEFIKTMIPCEQPGQLIMACQLEPEIAQLLRRAYKYHKAGDCCQDVFYKNKLKPEIESLIHPNRSDTRLQDIKTREQVLQTARAIMHLDENGNQKDGDDN